MPDITEIILKDISFLNQTKSIPQEVKQFIQDEFYCQLKKASQLFGKPTFSRTMTIFITEEDKRLFNSKDSYIVFQDYCINWTKNKPEWNLKEALSHEIVHLISGNEHGKPYRDPPFVMEEGIAYYNTQKLLEYVCYCKPCILNAINCIKDALKEVPDLLTKWRNQSDEAPVIQMLNDVDLKTWGLGVALRKRLLADFKLGKTESSGKYI